MHIDIKTLATEEPQQHKGKTVSGRLTVCFIAGLAGMIIAASLPPALQTTLRQEASYIEILSALCLLVSGVIFLFARPLRNWAHVSLLAFLLAEREFEPQVLTTDTLISTLAHWIDEQLLHNKAVIAGLALWLIYGFVRFTTPFMIDQVKRRTRAFGIISGAVVLAVASQACEAIGETLSDTSYWANAFLMWEELFELYFAFTVIAFAVAILKRNTPP